MIQDRVELFLSYVDKRGPDECWNWKGYIYPTGYGQWTWKGHRYRAHRTALEISTSGGAGKLCVCHRCDNPRCCNPAHLFVGTHADNMADKMAKGREARGERSHMSHLTEHIVKQIRLEFVYGSRVFGGRALARKYGVDEFTIRAIVNRKSWTHL